MNHPPPDLWSQVAEGSRAPIWLRDPTDPLEKAFVKFHRDNPGIYLELERRVLVLAELPKVKRIGIALLFESMRHDHIVQTKGEAWKLNNNHRALYARLLLHYRPFLAAKLETRERHPGAFRRAG